MADRLPSAQREDVAGTEEAVILWGISQVSPTLSIPEPSGHDGGTRQVLRGFGHLGPRVPA